MLNRLIYHRMAVKYNCYISTDAIIGKRVRLILSVVIAAVIEDDVTIFQIARSVRKILTETSRLSKIRRIVLYAESRLLEMLK